jgi:cyclohexyl-isocyanide hydratase
MNHAPLSVGMLLFEGVTQLDLTGPYEIMARMPNTKLSLIAERAAPVRTEWGMMISADASFENAPSIDVLVVPGGWGVDAQLENAAALAFIGERGARARYVTSVCSGASAASQTPEARPDGLGLAFRPLRGSLLLQLARPQHAWIRQSQ